MAKMQDSKGAVQALNKQIHLGFQALKPFRKTRSLLMSNIAGSHYGRSKQSRPLNLLYQIVTILIPSLAAGKHKLRVTTETPGMSPAAELTGLAVNFKFQKMLWDDTLHDIIFDALVGIGVSKTALMPPGEPPGVRGYLQHPGEAFTSRVSLDDLIIDPAAKDIRNAVFIADKYRLPRVFIERSGLYNPDAIKDLRSTAMYYGQPFQAAKLSRPIDIQQNANQLMDYVELVDCYLPNENVIKTLAWSEGVTDTLREFQWEGPVSGPYDWMTITPLPDNIMPIAPMSIVYDVDDAANDAMRKIIRRVREAKHILGYAGTAADDAQNIIDSSDLEAIRLDHPSSVKEFDFNGPDQYMYQHVGVLTGQASELSGNTSLLGGMRAQTDTLGQEQILLGRAGVRIGQMRSRVNAFSARVAAKHGWYIHYDPDIKPIPLIRRIAPGPDLPTSYSKETREGDWHDFNFKYQAYTEVELEPHVKAGRQMQWATEVVPAAMNLAMMTQGKFPAMKFARYIGEMLGLEGLQELNLDDEAVQLALEAAAVYPFEGQGQQAQKKIKQNSTGRTQLGMAPQLAGGARDNQTVNNGKFSSNPQSGAMTVQGA